MSNREPRFKLIIEYSPDGESFSDFEGESFSDFEMEKYLKNIINEDIIHNQDVEYIIETNNQRLILVAQVLVAERYLQSNELVVKCEGKLF